MNRLAIMLTSAALTGVLAVAAVAAPSNMMPLQESMDSSSAGSNMSSGTWADMPGGQAGRPYVKSLAVVNGTQRTQVFSGGADAAKNVANGDVTAVVSPINLCRANQAPASGQCYSKPNRVGIAIGYKSSQGLGIDFSNPAVPLNQTVNANTLFEVVIALNTLGKTLRWSWINGFLESWKTSDLGADAGEIRLRLRPADTPAIDWQTQSAGGCTATPIRDCNINRADGRQLAANLVLSLDETLDPALTGAAFATQGAISGYLVPGGSSSAPTLDLQIASSHFASDGSLQRGAIQAFLPAAALTSLYGVLPAEAQTFFAMTRSGDAGSNNAPTFTAINGSADDSAGLMINVTGITFSAPTYRVTRKGTKLRARASARGKIVSVKASSIKTCRAGACKATLYRIVDALSGKVVKVASGRTNRAGVATLKVKRRKLSRGSEFLLTVRKGSNPLASTAGRA